MATSSLEVKESGRALRVQTPGPHLVSMGSGRLSTAVTLHPLPEGRIILGSDRNADIPVTGTGVESVHCAIENNNGAVTLYPINGNTYVDGVYASTSIRLSQGCMLSIGRSNYMRFNNPAEAKHLKSVLPNSRISMAPISFSLLPDNSDDHLERKPPVAPRKSPRNSCSDDEIGFLGKVTKFEMLARQSRNCVSPKVFPAGSLTTNVPADQILGHSRTPSLTSLTKSHSSPLRNLTNFDRSRSNTPCHGTSSGNVSHIDDNRQKIDSRTPSRSNTPNSEYHTSTPNYNQIQMYTTAEAFVKGYKSQCVENNNENDCLQSTIMSSKLNGSNFDLMSRSLTCQMSSDFDKFGREFDMSQSLIVAKTTMTEYLQVDKFGSNPNLCNRSSSIYQSNPSINNIQVCQNFGSNPSIKRSIQAPSPSFNRNPKYNEQRRIYGRIKSPTPSACSSCSLEELQERQADAESKRKEAEIKRKIVQEARIREQEIEKQEKIRLEEILAMCADYERQSTLDKPRQPNRIKTNGSLPRDKRPSYNSPYHSPKSPINSPQHFSYESLKQNSSNTSFQDDDVSNNSLSTSTTHPTQQMMSPNNNHALKWPNGQTNMDVGFSTSLSQSRSTDQDSAINQNRLMDLDRRNGSITQSQSTFSTIQLNGTKINSSRKSNQENITNDNLSIYENVPISMQQNNNQDYTTPKRNGHLTNSCEVIENKLAISNDDLLEAIEQLSMLSKSKEICITPKRNNLEKNNAKSNEVKADKERRELEDEDRKKYIAFLQNEKLHILGNMDMLKRSVADIEIQEDEISQELGLEKALLSAEFESESLKLTTDEAEKISIQMRINDLEREMAEDRASQANLQTEAKTRVENAQQLCNRLEDELKICNSENEQHSLLDKLHVQQDALETERKTFEDLEFHHLEEEASKLATREELQRYLSELSNKIEARKAQLDHLELQRTEVTATAAKESKSLERQKLGHLRRLEEGRNRLRAIDDELEKLTQNVTDNCEDKRSPSREDFDRISRVTIDSPIVNNHGSLGKKTMESLREIERNRQLHLAKQGSQVISEERRRVEELKRRVQDEVRSQWEERKMNCTSFNSVESGEESSSYSTGPTESGSGSSDGADVGACEKLSPNKLSEFTLSSPGQSNDSYSLLPSDNMRDGRRTSMEGERLSSNSVGTADENRSRPLSQTSSEMDSVGSLQTVKHRDKPKLQRPLTRYLPIKSESLDLKHHIETAGHQLPLIPDVILDTTTCSGYLSKMSKKFHHWNKRWFVFDRKRKTLSYFSDSSSKKPRGLIYFQSISEVYVDHMNTVRSPQPSLTFIIKTSTRLYHLMAPSPEAMRVWVDVVITGAEGYQEFDHGV